MSSNFDKHFKFWKLSQGAGHFTYEDVLNSIRDRLAYINIECSSLFNAEATQADNFITAPDRDYFFLTHGNQGIYLLGQFAGPANVFSAYGDGWIDRRFRIIKTSVNPSPYAGAKRQWTPNFMSTFAPVPQEQLKEFEEGILFPYFNIKLEHFGC